MSEDIQMHKRLFQPDDISGLTGLSGPKLSPGNSHVLCTVSVADKDKNGVTDNIAIISLENKEIRYIAKGSSPEWNPAGTQIAYESDQGIWIYDLQMDTTKFLVPVFYSVYFIDHYEKKNFAWSPDGNSIAYVSTPHFNESDNEFKEIREIDNILYKTKGGRGRSFFADQHLTHIWMVPVSGGITEQITEGKYNEHSISWSPDGSQIAFISNHTDDPGNNQFNDLWTVDIRSKKITRLTENKGTAFQPAWSPDGKYIACLKITGMNSTNDSPAEDTHLFIIDPVSAKSKDLTKSFDRRIENISWDNVGDSIYFTAGNHGTTPLYRVYVTDEKIQPVIEGDFHVLEYSVGKDVIANTRISINRPVELFINNVQLTVLNDNITDNFLLQDAETFWFSSFDGTSVQGWIMKPVLFDDKKDYPLVLVIHGGPHNMFGYDFEDRMQTLASNGFAVLFINPRGSSGYGQTFSSGNVRDWGGGDYKDLMAGVDHVIANNSWINAKKLFVTGQSYGGYMTNWIITQTNRFQAAVADGGLSNLISFGGTSLYHSLMESEFEGKVHENYELLWHCSPLKHVKNVTTPVLLLHGQLDNEVPFSQAEEMFIALKKNGVKTSLVLYAGEGHGWRPDMKPANRKDVLNRIINWFGSHL